MAHLVLMIMMIIFMIPEEVPGSASEARSLYLVRKFKESSKKKFPHDDSASEELTDVETIRSSILNRNKRNVENEKQARTVSTKETLNKTTPHLELMPITMKLTKTFYGENTLPPAAPLIGKFARSPFEYSKIQHEEESMAIDTPSLSMCYKI